MTRLKSRIIGLELISPILCRKSISIHLIVLPHWRCTLCRQTTLLVFVHQSSSLFTLLRGVSRTRRALPIMEAPAHIPTTRIPLCSVGTASGIPHRLYRATLGYTKYWTHRELTCNGNVLAHRSAGLRFSPMRHRREIRDDLSLRRGNQHRLVLAPPALRKLPIVVRQTKAV